MNQKQFAITGGSAAIGAAVLLLAGAGGTYLTMRTAPTEEMASVPAPSAGPRPSMPPDDAPLPDVVVPLSVEAIRRAGIVVMPVSSASQTKSIHLPGLVEANAYRRVAVTPLVAGRVTRVNVELGVRVRRGQTLAQIYSPELAEAQTRYVTARARLSAHDQELRRTERLVEIGAASRQELEGIHAEHAAQTAEVESARSRLELLGVARSALDRLTPEGDSGATISVTAPIDGVVIERGANAGLNVDPTMALFTIVDLSTVWVIADLYEKDFSRVSVGHTAAITTTAYPDRVFTGRVSYIDPQVNPDTRTAKVRVEVANPLGELRLGMYADASIAGPAGGSMLVIPRTALQEVGARQVVYLVNPTEPGQFIERDVRPGQAVGPQIEVLSGLNAGDTVVAEGSFFLRAERERLGLRHSSRTAPNPHAGMSGMSEPKAGQDSAIQAADVAVSDKGFEPSRLTLRAGIPARVTFTRTTDATCATAVVFPSLKITRDLPLNQRIAIEFTPEMGEIAFACGMNMFRGSVIAK